MASVVEELNELLKRERGEVEAVDTLIAELEDTDPDIAEGAADVLDTASWSCSGLYHRINQLGGTPTLDSTNLAEDMEDQESVKGKLELLCKSQYEDNDRVKAVLDRDDLDETTRGFLSDLLNAHADTVRWCETALTQWKVDAWG